MDNENAEQNTQRPLQEDVSAGLSPQALRRVPVPLFAVAVYLILGFRWNLWHPGWLLFLAIPVYYALVSMLTATSIRKKLHRFPVALLCVTAYLILGFTWDFWHPGWMIFLLIPIYHSLVNAIFPKEKNL